MHDQHLGVYSQAREATEAIRKRLGLSTNERVSDVGIVLGSGLGGFREQIFQNGCTHTIPYAEIPHFPVASVRGHASCLVFGFLEQRPLLVMQGRTHLYEGFSPQQVVFPMRVLLMLGVRTLVLTNASGGISKDLLPGDWMVIEDHINLTGHNPLCGPEDERLGSRFIDMTEAYSVELQNLAMHIAKGCGLKLQKGVYAGVLGPSYETPAEVRMLRQCGADAVGMSTVLEAIVARQGGAKVLGMSCVTNHAAGLSKQPLSHAEVLEISSRALRGLVPWMLQICKELPKTGEQWV